MESIQPHFSSHLLYIMRSALAEEPSWYVKFTLPLAALASVVQKSLLRCYGSVSTTQGSPYVVRDAQQNEVGTIQVHAADAPFDRMFPSELWVVGQAVPEFTAVVDTLLKGFAACNAEVLLCPVPPPTVTTPNELQVSSGPNPQPVTDPTDKKILDLAIQNPDLSDTEIGLRVGLGRGAVNERRKKLQAMGHPVRR